MLIDSKAKALKVIKFLFCKNNGRKNNRHQFKYINVAHSTITEYKKKIAPVCGCKSITYLLYCL